MTIGYTVNQVLNDEKGDPECSLNRRICKGQSDAIQNALQWRKFSSKNFPTLGGQQQEQNVHNQTPIFFGNTHMNMHYRAK